MNKRQLHVVIIEDDPATLAWLRLLATREGLQVTAMETVKDLSALTALKADAFVIDEELPGITGHLICMFLRTKASTSHLPVVLISAYPELFHFADSCGADERLAKPFTAEQFLDALNRLLTKNRY